MRGLDPRIHLLGRKLLRRRMDCRVSAMPGNDGLGAYAQQATTIALGRKIMSNGRVELTRRQWLVASALAVALPARPAWALETNRQGFQTNIWGMATHYPLKSGLLGKAGPKFGGITVPSRHPP